MTPPHEWCKVDQPVGRLVSSGGGFGRPIGLPLPLHRVRIECAGVAWSEGRSGGDQDVVEAAVEFAAGTHLDAGGVDTLFLREVLSDVEVTLCGGIRWFIGRMPADDYQLGGGLAVEGKGDLVEATFGFVVDADGAFSVALEGDAAEVACLRCDRGRRSRNGDGGVRSGLFAEVINDVAGDVDGA